MSATLHTIGAERAAKPSQTTIPSYAVDLLLAAKWVARPPVNATPESLAADQERLNDAVCAFEAQMPVVDGVILVEDAIVYCPAHRAGAEAALSFLRDHEDRAVILPAELHHHLVALGDLHCEEARAFLFVVGAFLSQSMIGHVPNLKTWDVDAALAGIEE
ncbi:hypothetical protein [Cupriavidus pinatubonensis]|uniref:Uncharacterized protein n=1 Tax=Cupriavidus pinatubonensis TaxID=248026 RepID=A0ABN7Y415_9BURK|nr:hypothetical protein [Cupriavidus pinatubonensis]CAG9168110.1 hypothetical protein LMG23994_01309 [Cupriavidus pinatubonensis]